MNRILNGKIYETIKVGTWFYKITKDRKTRHKINYIGDGVFEWGLMGKTAFGWGEIKDLTINPDNKSRIKFIKDERGK